MHFIHFGAVVRPPVIRHFSRYRFENGETADHQSAAVHKPLKTIEESLENALKPYLRRFFTSEEQGRSLFIDNETAITQRN